MPLPDYSKKKATDEAARRRSSGDRCYDMGFDLDLSHPDKGNNSINNNSHNDSFSEIIHSGQNNNAFDNLCRALAFLYHPVPADIAKECDIEALLQWAITHWDRSKIPSVLSVVVED